MSETMIERSPAERRLSAHPILWMDMGDDASGACVRLPVAKQEEFFSDNVKDQRRAAQRCGQCAIQQWCRDEALQGGYRNAVYGGLTRAELGSELRRYNRIRQQK